MDQDNQPTNDNNRLSNPAASPLSENIQTTNLPSETGDQSTQQPVLASASTEAVAVHQPIAGPFSRISLILTGLLLLTFFTPLGSALFLPIVLVGIYGAYRHVQKRTIAAGKPTTGPKAVALTIVRVIIIIGGVIALGIVALIGILFLLLSTHTIDFRMGS